jgi:restriction system protein
LTNRPIVALFTGNGKWGVALKNIMQDSNVAVWAILFGICCFGLRAIVRVYARKSATRKVAAAVDRHLMSLVRRRAQLVGADAYGKPLVEKWTKEVFYFFDQHIAPSLTPTELALLNKKKLDTIMTIVRRVENEAQANPAFLSFSDDMTPNEFETYCAEELRRAGWNARVTLQSRDQGVDVVAEKDGIRVVVQCKLYSRPVGNKAVQETAAARAHEKADYGVVVTNNRYTSDAEQLATTNNIFLLHFSDLRNLQTLLQPVSSWYYDKGNGQVGPVSFTEVKRALSGLTPNDDLYVWCQGMENWELAQNVPQLGRYVSN